MALLGEQVFMYASVHSTRTCAARAALRKLTWRSLPREYARVCYLCGVKLGSIEREGSLLNHSRY
mgnify:CR=1 FL=1